MAPERNPLFQSSTQSPDELRAEADRICEMLADHLEEMRAKDRDFVISLDDGREVTSRMIFWLRDLKDRYA